MWYNAGSCKMHLKQDAIMRCFGELKSTGCGMGSAIRRFAAAVLAAGTLAAGAAFGGESNWKVLPMYGGGYVQNLIISPSAPKVWYTYVDVGGPYRSDDAGRTWRALHGNLSAADRAVSGDNLRSMSVDPRDANSFVMVSGGSFAKPAGIYVSRDGGRSFRKTAVGRFYGNGGAKGAGFCLARDPFDPDRLVAAGDWDGVMVSRDNGETWTTSGLLTETFVRDIRFDRVVRDRLYASTCLPGDLGGRTYRQGFFRSDDGGASWTKLADASPYEICQLAGSTELLAYFPDARELRRSSDGGATWTAYAEGLPTWNGSGYVAEGNILAFGTGSDFYLCGDGNGSIFRRKPGDPSWTAVPHDSTLPGNPVTEPRMTWITNAKFDALCSLVVDPANDDHWLATDFYEIWESTDAGKNWTTRIQGIMQLVSHTIEFDPFSPSNIVYGVADMGLFYSADGGRSFKHPGLTNPSRGWVYACTASFSRRTKGLVMICGGKDYGIVLRSRNSGRSWQDTALRGLPALDASNPGVRAYSIAANPTKEEFLICLSGPVGQGKGGVYRTENGGDDWEWAGDGLPEGLDLFRDGEWSGGGVFSQIYFSADGSAVCSSSKQGKSWFRGAGETVWVEASGSPGIMSADPFRPGRMLGGAWPIAETLDGGKTWGKLKTNIGQVSYVHIDQKVKDLVVAGLPDRTVWLSRDAGHTFRKVEGSDKVPSGCSSKVVIDRGRMYYLSTGSGVWTATTPYAEASTNDLERLLGDALIWWRGPWDANRDGKLTQDELFNHRFPKTDSVRQTAQIGGDGTCSIVKDDVVTPWSGTTNAYPVARLSQDGATATKFDFKLSDAGLETNIYAMTYYVRCKWDGDYGAAGSGSANLFYGVNYSQWRGAGLSFTANGLAYNLGRRNFTSSAFVPAPGTWYDVFLRLSDSPDETAGHNIGLSVYIRKAGGTSWLWPGSEQSWWTWANVNETGTGLRTLRMGPNDTLSFCERFKGCVSQLGFWERQLTETEMREINAIPEITPDLISLGFADGSSAEFAPSAAAADRTIEQPGLWDGAPPELNDACPSFTVSFTEKAYPVYDSAHGMSQISYWDSQAHVLIVKPTPESGSCALRAVIDAGKEKEIVLGNKAVSASRPGYFYVDRLSRGAHTLTLSRVSGSIRLDYVKLGGDFCIGARTYQFVSPGGQYNGNLAPYCLRYDTPSQMSGSVMAETNPWTAEKATTFAFDMTAEQTALEYRYVIATGQSDGAAAANLILYVNGSEYDRIKLPWQYSDCTVNFPANTFAAGRNTLAWRFDTLEHASSYWVGTRGHFMSTVRSSIPDPGLCLTVR